MTSTTELHNVGVRAWLVVALLWPVAVLNYLDRLMITTMHDPIVASIPMTDEQFGLLTAVFLWVYAICSPVAGFLADRFSRWRLIVASLAIWSGLTWFTAHANNYEQLLAARALMGISEAFYIPAALATIADYHPGSTRSLANGLHMSGIYAGMALGGIGGYLAEHFSWRWAFARFGLFGVVYAVILAFCLRDAMRTVNRNTVAAAARPITVAYAIRGLLGKPPFWLLMVVTALFGIANWGINGWLPTYLRDHFSLGIGTAGMSATAYIQVASFVGVVGGGAWADRWSRTNPRGRALVPAIGFAVAAPCLLLAATTNVLPFAIMGLIVYGLGRGFFDANLMPVMRQAADQRLSATGYALLNVVSCASGGITIWAAGRLKDSRMDLGRVFVLSAAAIAVASILLLAVNTRKPETPIDIGNAE